MGCCESKNAAPAKEPSEQYVTEEEEEEVEEPNESYSESQSSIDDDVTLTPRTREETQAAIRKHSMLPESSHASPMPSPGRPVKDTFNLSRGIDEDGYQWINQYVLIRKLGKGSYGKVKLCIDAETGQYVALKVCNKAILGRKRRGGFTAGTLLEDVRREIAILKQLNHPNIVRLFEVIDDEDDDKLYMVFEYVPGGALMKRKIEQEPLDMPTARSYLRDILLGLEYLHHMKIIHRDIKPENLLRGEQGIKISDFGVSHLFESDDRLQRTAGSPAFLAPEIVAGGSEFSGKAIDVWALGVTLWVFIFGSLPFMAETEYAVYDKIREAVLEFPHAVEPQLETLLRGILTRDPEKRLTIPQIKAHSWVTLNGAFPMPQMTYPEPLTPSTPERASAFEKRRIHTSGSIPGQVHSKPVPSGQRYLTPPASAFARRLPAGGHDDSEPEPEDERNSPDSPSVLPVPAPRSRQHDDDMSESDEARPAAPTTPLAVPKHVTESSKTSISNGRTATDEPSLSRTSSLAASDGTRRPSAGSRRLDSKGWPGDEAELDRSRVLNKMQSKDGLSEFSLGVESPIQTAREGGDETALAAGDSGRS